MRNIAIALFTLIGCNSEPPIVIVNIDVLPAPVATDAVETDGTTTDTDTQTEDTGLDADHTGTIPQETGDTAEPCTLIQWHRDMDLDGFAGDEQIQFRCVGDYPGADWLLAVTDCDDQNAGTNPLAVEYCDNVDSNCNGLVDDEALDASTLYPDADGDGFGYTPWPLRSCNMLPGYSLTNGDCDDTDPTAWYQDFWAVDLDADGHNGWDSVVLACGSPGPDYHTDDMPSDDCDDHNPDINSGEVEICGGGLDEDCDGLIDTDDNPECPYTTDVTVINVPMGPEGLAVGNSDAHMVQLEITAGSRAAAHLSYIGFEIVSDDDTTLPGSDNLPDPEDRFTSCWLADENGVFVGGFATPNGHWIEFTNADLWIEEADTTILNVFCELSTVGSMSNNTDRFVFLVTSVSDMAFEDGDFGTPVTDIFTPDGLPNSNHASQIWVYPNGQILTEYTGPLGGNVTAGQMRVPVLDLRMLNRYEALLVEELGFFFQDDYQVISMVQLVYTDSSNTLVTTSALVDPATGIVRFTGLDLLLVENGYWQGLHLSVDVSALALPGDQFTAVYDPGLTQAIGLDSGVSIPMSSMTPGSDIVGQTFTIQ